MTKKSNSQTPETKKTKTSYSVELSGDSIGRLQDFLSQASGFKPYEVGHSLFAYKGDQVNVVGYKSHKVVIQGKKTEAFVQFVLEPEITGEPRMGYEELQHPEWYEPHAGLDESGKGDFFGPLVSACVIADAEMVRAWRQAGIQDSKRISSDASILKMENMIRKTKGVVVRLCWANMLKYNELHQKFEANTNKLLAWMHAKSLQEALKIRRVEWGMLDQFSKAPLVQRYFREDPIDLRMVTKAESDPVVAAASICARAEYVRQMRLLSEKSGLSLKKGASAMVKEQAVELVQTFGKEALYDYAKMHFRTSQEVLAKASQNSA